MGYIVVERLDEGAFSDAIVFEMSSVALVLGSIVAVGVDKCLLLAHIAYSGPPPPSVFTTP